MRACFSQISDARSRRRRVDVRGRWSPYQRAAVSSEPTQRLIKSDTYPFKGCVCSAGDRVISHIRYEYARRSRREKIVWSARGPRETARLLISLTGLGIPPLIFVAAAISQTYTFHPVPTRLGVFFAITALGMFEQRIGRSAGIGR